MPRFDGTDTSNNQGPHVVDIGPSIVAAGGKGWWHKATQGSSYRDPYWPTCRKARIAAGLRYGGPYHWISPNSTAAAQFANFHGYVGDLLPGECIQLDTEDPAGLSDALVIECIDLWEATYPGRVLVYVGRYYQASGGKYLIDRLLAHYGEQRFRWWLPAYQNTFPTASSPTLPIIWQYSGGLHGAILPPLTSGVDSNQIMVRDRLEAASGYGTDPPPPQPLPGGDDLTLALIIVDDAYARFAGDMDAQGVVNTVRWIGPRLNGVIGFKPDNVTPRLAGTQVLHRKVANMTDFTLDGPVPSGDKVTWTAANFYQGD